jgi:hypothetical protein
VVTHGGPSDVTGAEVTDSFPSIFTGVTFTASQKGRASNRARIAETDGSATFSFEIRRHKLPHAREMMSRTPVCAPGFPQEAGLDFIYWGIG